MSKFNERPVGTKTKNLAGGDAYNNSTKLEIVNLILTSFVEDQFYRPATDTIKRVKELVEKEPLFAAKAAVFARNEFGMRSISHVFASEIARHVSSESWAKNFYSKVVRRPDDITEIIAYHLMKNGKISNAMKKGLAKSFGKFDGYQLGKYRGDKNEVKLIDAVRLLHPVPNDRNAEALKELSEGTLRSKKTFQRAVSEAGKAENKKEAKAKAWGDVIDDLGYMALLKNLRNIEEDAPELIERATSRLLDRIAIRKSLVLPFRFYDAISNVSDRRLKVAISQAADYSIDNLPDLSGRSLIAIDVSGSMMGRTEKIARMFGSILYKGLDSDVVTFDSRSYHPSLNPADSVFSIMDKIHFRGGGTNFSSIFEGINKKYDRIFILSDMQSWMETQANYFWSCSRSVKESFRDYRDKYNKDVKLYSFDLQGYGTSQFPEQNVYALSGFSDKVFDMIDSLEQDRDAMIKRIEKLQF